MDHGGGDACAGRSSDRCPLQHLGQPSDKTRSALDGHVCAIGRRAHSRGHTRQRQIGRTGTSGSHGNDRSTSNRSTKSKGSRRRDRPTQRSFSLGQRCRDARRPALRRCDFSRCRLQTVGTHDHPELEPLGASHHESETGHRRTWRVPRIRLTGCSDAHLSDRGAASAPALTTAFAEACASLAPEAGTHTCVPYSMILLCRVQEHWRHLANALVVSGYNETTALAS